MEAFNWALIGVSGDANLELALAGLEFARKDLENQEVPVDSETPEMIPLNYPYSDSEIEDDESSDPGSPWRDL
jgi:hypothetical protein